MKKVRYESPLIEEIDMHLEDSLMIIKGSIGSAKFTPLAITEWIAPGESIGNGGEDW